MATITGIKFYLERILENPTSLSVIVKLIEGVSALPTNPSGDVSASKELQWTDIPYDSPGWVTFTFDSPVTITENGWYAIQIEIDSLYLNQLKIYEASGWSEYGDEPYDGQEKAYLSSGGLWFDSDYDYAYEILTSGITGNGATSPTETYEITGKNGLKGVRSYLEALSPPSKPTTPSPANVADDVVLDQETITWEDGGGATSYDVWYGENEAGLTKVSAGQEETSFTISGIDYGSPFDYVVSRTWRIDAINAAGTTTGYIWTFTTIVFDPPQVTYVLIDGGNERGPYDDPPGVEGTDWRWTGESNMITVRRLVAAAYNKIWYEDI